MVFDENEKQSIINEGSWFNKERETIERYSIVTAYSFACVNMYVYTYVFIYIYIIFLHLIRHGQALNVTLSKVKEKIDDGYKM